MQSTSNWRVLSLSMILMACGATDKVGDTSGTSTTDDTGTLSTTVTGTTTTENVSASLSGVITDSAGADLPETDIRFCRGSACRVFKTEGNGDYHFNSVAVDAWFSLELVAPRGSGMATALVPVTFADQEARVLDIQLPMLDAATALGAPAAIEMGSGLWITIGIDDLETPFLFEDATEAAGVQVAPGQWVPTDGVTGTVAAMWHTAPFDYHAPDGLPVSINAADAGLTGGGPYTLWVASYTASTWLEVGALTDDGMGTLTTTGTLPLLSTIMVTE